MNLIGLVQALLININYLAGLEDPQYKVTPVGFLRMLLENPVTAKISNAKQIQNGLERTLKVRYMQRGLESDVTDKDDCDTPIGATWKETEIGRPLFNKIGIFISDEEMRKWQEEANKTLAAGTPSEPMMVGLYEVMIVKLNGLIQKIDSNLLSAQSTKWGVNAASGSAVARAINFSNTIDMEDGIIKLITDVQLNEIAGEPVVVGNGIINAWQIAQSKKAGTDAQGFSSTSIRYYDDINSVSKWGANHFGVFAPGLTGFVDFNKNVGAYAGVKGGSIFFTIPVPVVLANGTLSSLVFDAQLKYEDCPIYDEAGDKIADRGWKLILSKSYGLFNAPNDMFAAGDRLAGYNGALHYVAGAASKTVTVAPESTAIFKTKEQA